MAGLRNAFKYRLADRFQLDTGRFIGLYCPTLLNHLTEEDFALGRLLAVRGSPGSGKSTLLRLVQTETLLSLHSLGTSHAQQLIARLEDLGVFKNGCLRVIGLYVHCDSNLRDIANRSSALDHALFNTLLDVRITLAFLRGVEQAFKTGVLPEGVSADASLQPLTGDQSAPRLFASPHTAASLKKGMRAFGGKVCRSTKQFSR